MKSNELDLFIKEIKYNNRNPKNQQVLDILNDKDTNPVLSINKEELLFRARIVEPDSPLERKQPFYGFSEKDSFVPPVNKTKDMRANYKYIPYLYCSNKPYIAISEVKPRVGAKISVASILVLDTLKLFDLTMQSKPINITKEKEDLLNDLSEIFSKPITADDEYLDYIPSQYISEFIKNIGYDGIVYRSVYDNDIFNLSSNASKRRYNIVIFNYDKCKPVATNMIKIKNINIECELIDESSGLDVNSPIEEALSDL
ncbi:MAG: RES family NAD+ phosphorylase [Candidatus ainarchaeum sp.]|jgi:hypothetical protein|nr:RES family NAD+ phosphorylase [Candidatus ainarchaeum sp.]